MWIVGIYRVPDKLSGVMANSLDDDYLMDKSVSEHTIYREGFIHIDTSQSREKFGIVKGEHCI